MIVRTYSYWYLGINSFVVYYGSHEHPAMINETFDEYWQAEKFAEYLDNRGFPYVELSALEG